MSHLSPLDVEILHAAVRPDESSFSPTTAKAILKLGFSKQQRAEVEKLLDKNNQGTISAKERKKLEVYVRVGDFLSLLKAKIRYSQPRNAKNQ